VRGGSPQLAQRGPSPTVSRTPRSIGHVPGQASYPPSAHASDIRQNIPVLFNKYPFSYFVRCLLHYDLFLYQPFSFYSSVLLILLYTYMPFYCFYKSSPPRCFRGGSSAPPSRWPNTGPLWLTFPDNKLPQPQPDAARTPQLYYTYRYAFWCHFTHIFSTKLYYGRAPL